MEQAEIVGQKISELAQAVRDYCLAQRETWRQIPALVTRSWRFPGYGAYQLVYLRQQLPMPLTAWPWRLGVELATGRLIRIDQPEQNPTTAELVELALRLDQLNAAAIVVMLREESKQIS